MEEIYSWIKNILIFMIINTIIMNLLGNKSYKKYVSIVSGMVLVLIVISPVMKLMKLEGNLDYYLQANEFAIETSDFKNDLNRMEEEQRDAIFAEYKEKIRLQVEELLSEDKVSVKSIKIVLDQDPSSTSFGEIKGMVIEASTAGDKDVKDENSLSIEEVEIAGIIIGKTTENADSTVPSPMEINIKKRIADFYNIEQGNINISIQGE